MNVADKPAPALYEIELVFANPRGERITSVFSKGDHYLGRSPDCSVCFASQYEDVSRKHALLSVTDDKAVLKDLDSLSGTMVNGKIITSHTLEHGDVISIGEWVIEARLPIQKRAEESSLVLKGLDRDHLSKPVTLLRADLDDIQAATKRIMDNVAKRIVGQEPVIRLIWATILAKGHCLLLGVPGLAKTMMVTTFGDILGLRNSRIQFTPDLMPSDIIGSYVIREASGGERKYEFIQGPIFTQLLLADEINRTPPKTQSALLEAMQERQVTVANKTYNLPNPFCVIATQNPIEQEGTYPLPEAQQDRFMLCIRLDYSQRNQEIEILLRTTFDQTAKVETVCDYEKIMRYQQIVNSISVSREAATYAADLIRATRPVEENPHADIRTCVDWGAGPRAGQALIRIAKAMAAMEGRPGISTSDIKEVALPVLRHRICFNYRGRTKFQTEDKLIEWLLGTIKPE